MPEAGAPQTFAMAAIYRAGAATRLPAEVAGPATVGIAAVGLLGVLAIVGPWGAAMDFAVLVALSGAVVQLPGLCGSITASRCAGLADRAIRKSNISLNAISLGRKMS